MKKESGSFQEESLKNKRLNVSIVCLYGYPQKHDTEPFAGQTLKALLDKKFPNSVSSQIYLLGQANDESNNVETLAKKLVTVENSQVIGISIPQGTYEIAKEFLSALDKFQYKGLKVLGHALPTYIPDDFINLFPDALIIKGWGENSFCDIVEKELNHSKSFSDIPNLTYLQNNKIINNPIEWPEDFIPSTRYDVKKFFPRIEASRGCHHDKCTFCTRPLREKDQVSWVRISPKIVLQDIENLHENGIDKFTFTDEDFIGNDLSGASQIANGLKKIGGLNFALDLRADSILNPKDSPTKAHERDLLIRTLKEAGLSLVYIGAETFSESQLKRYGKGTSPKKEISSIKKIIDLSIPIELGLITFDPFLSIQELSENTKTLESSGMWFYSGQLFNELHIFEGNSYCNLIKRANLDRDFDPNYITYSYAYLNPEIKQIRDECISFKNEFDSVYTSARNIFRTNFNVPDFLNTYITNYRKNELLTLKLVLQNPLDKKKIFEDACNKERQNIQILSSLIQMNFPNTEPEYVELIDNINKYTTTYK